MRSDPHSFVMRAVPWNVFGTLTWAGEPPKHEEVALALGSLYLGRVRIALRYAPREWFWFLRAERGESGGRVHLHCLIRCKSSNLGWFCPGEGRLAAAHRSWRKGRTDFRHLNDGGASVIPYLEKPDTGGADSYEMSKTAAARYTLASYALRRRALLQLSAGPGRTPTENQPSAHWRKDSEPA